MMNMNMRKMMKVIGVCSMAAILMMGATGCGGKAASSAVSSGKKDAA